MILGCTITFWIAKSIYCTPPMTKSAIDKAFTEEHYRGNDDTADEVIGLMSQLRYMKPVGKDINTTRFISFDNGAQWWKLKSDSGFEYAPYEVVHVTSVPKEEATYLLARYRMYEQLGKSGLEPDEAEQFVDDVTTVLEHDTRGVEIDVADTDTDTEE
jgi:hypothetical protein